MSPTNPNPAPEPLEWGVSRTDSAINAMYYRLSRCGRYSISETRSKDVVRYEAWLRSVPEIVRNLTDVVRPHVPARRLGMFAKPQTAKDCCQRHADKRDGKYVEQLLEGQAA